MATKLCGSRVAEYATREGYRVYPDPATSANPARGWRVELATKGRAAHKEFRLLLAGAIGFTWVPYCSDPCCCGYRMTLSR